MIDTTTTPKQRYRRRVWRGKPQPTFIERKAGDDVVQDIIDAAACIRHAHPSYRDAAPLMTQEGGVRCFWALMLDAFAKSSGMSIDDLIERIRAQHSVPIEDGDKGDERG